MSLLANPNLFPFRIVLTKDNESVVFECYAKEQCHAREQAENAYPKGNVQIVSELGFVIFSQKEADNSAQDFGGFWNREFGWGDLDSASFFSEGDQEHISVPNADNTVKWMRLAEARTLCGSNFTIRLTLDVTYSLNGERDATMAANLERLVEVAVGEGMLTGATDAVVEDYSFETTILGHQTSVVPAGVSSSGIIEVYMPDLLGVEYERPESIPAWQWVMNHASFSNCKNGVEPGCFEFVINMSNELEDIPLELQPVIQFARKERATYMVCYQ